MNAQLVLPVLAPECTRVLGIRSHPCLPVIPGISSRGHCYASSRSSTEVRETHVPSESWRAKQRNSEPSLQLHRTPPMCHHETKSSIFRILQLTSRTACELFFNRSLLKDLVPLCLSPIVLLGHHINMPTRKTRPMLKMAKPEAMMNLSLPAQGPQDNTGIQAPQRFTANIKQLFEAKQISDQVFLSVSFALRFLRLQVQLQVQLKVHKSEEVGT